MIYLAVHSGTTSSRVWLIRNQEIANACRRCPKQRNRRTQSLLDGIRSTIWTHASGYHSCQHDYAEIRSPPGKARASTIWARRACDASGSQALLGDLSVVLFSPHIPSWCVLTIPGESLPGSVR